MRTILRETRLDPAKLDPAKLDLARVESGLRRSLTYSALLFATGTVIGNAVTFLAYFPRAQSM